MYRPDDGWNGIAPLNRRKHAAHFGGKSNSMNDSGWCALCRARKVRAGKPGRAPSD